MRKSLESASLAWEEFLQVSDITVMFDNQSDYWLDVDELLMTTESCPIDEIIEASQRSTLLYKRMVNHKSSGQKIPLYK